MYGFEKLSGGTVDSKNQLLQTKGTELVRLTRDQCKFFELPFSGKTREDGVFRAIVLKEQIARMKIAAGRNAEREDDDRRAAVFAVASMHPNCFVGIDS